MKVERDKIALDAIPNEQASGKQARRSKGQKTPVEPQSKEDAQPFDNLTKALFGLDGAQIIPELVPGVQVEAAQNRPLSKPVLQVIDTRNKVKA